MPVNPKVFISYSHQSPNYEGRVLSFADKLRYDGIDATIDLYEEAPSEGWPRWMENQIRVADYVLVINSKSYYDKCYLSNKGKGISWEVNLVYQSIYDANTQNTKFIPVFFDQDDVQYILTAVKSFTYYNIGTEEGYEKLYWRLRGVTQTQKPSLGELRPLPIKERKTMFLYYNLPERNPYFTGRNDILKSIYNDFQSGERINLCQTISGLGGIGKTQCAIEYAYCHQTEYNYVLWVNAESTQLIYSSFKGIAKNLNLLQNDRILDEEELQLKIKGWFETHENILIIFDNVDNENAIKQYLPPTDKANVLITSRKMNIYGTHRVDISVFSEKEAVDFLIMRTQKEDRENAGKIAERLGFLALALNQATAYILITSISFAGYIELLDSYGLAVFDPKMKLTSDEYKKLVTATWDISFEKIKDKSARQLFNLCAYMAPDNIPVDLFESQHDFLPEPLRTDIQNKLACERILADLQEYTLAERKNDNTLNIHRLVQEVVRDKLKGDFSWLQCCIDMMKSVMPKNYSDRTSRETFSLYAEHAKSVAEYAMIFGE